MRGGDGDCSFLLFFKFTAKIDFSSRSLVLLKPILLLVRFLKRFSSEKWFAGDFCFKKWFFAVFKSAKNAPDCCSAVYVVFPPSAEIRAPFGSFKVCFAHLKFKGVLRVRLAYRPPFGKFVCFYNMQN